MRKATDAPFGFVPFDQVLQITAYRKDASAARVYPGDVVTLEADGNIAPYTAGVIPLGVAAEGSAGSTADTEVLVYDHPYQRFMVQDDSDTTHMAETEIGTTVAIVTTAGNTTTDRSNMEIDSSTAAAGGGAARPVLVRMLHPIEDGSFADAAGKQRRWIVSFGLHALATSSGI